MKEASKYILGIIICLIIGFFIGRLTVNTKTDIKYVKGETVRDYIPILTPFKVTRPSDPIYLRDTINGKIDTAGIIADWVLKREYKQTLFDNNNGKLDIDFSVQYNKPFNFGYSFTPIHKEINTYKEKVWQPYLSGSYSTLDIAGIGGGLFYHNLGIEYQYQKDFRSNSTGHSFGLKYKF